MPSPSIPPAPPRQNFQKLPGRLTSMRFRVSGAGQVSLWLGEDCLVQTRMMFCREHYNRFDYKEIQALVLRRTARGMIYNLILGGLAAIFAGLGFYVNNSDAWIAFGVIIAFWLILLLINAIRGATCRCTLQTSLGSKPLPTLNRMRPAKRAMARIAERVEAVQGALPPQDAAERMDAFLFQQAQTMQPQPAPAANPRST
jgi:hypothetical protein